MRSISILRASFGKAVDYYAAIDVKLAQRFIDAVNLAKTEIGRFPRIGKVCNGYRAYLIKGFPYSLCYREDLNGELVALLLFHHKQASPRIT